MTLDGLSSASPFPQTWPLSLYHCPSQSPPPPCSVGRFLRILHSVWNGRYWMESLNPTVFPSFTLHLCHKSVSSHTCEVVFCTKMSLTWRIPAVVLPARTAGTGMDWTCAGTKTPSTTWSGSGSPNRADPGNCKWRIYPCWIVDDGLFGGLFCWS